MFYRNLCYNLVYELNPPMTEIMQSIISFHGYIWIFLLFIAIFVFSLLSQICFSMARINIYLIFVELCYSYFEVLLITLGLTLPKDISKPLHPNDLTNAKYDGFPVITHAPKLELIWTLTPSVILFFIAIPSFSLLYSVDEPIDPVLSTKVIGYQWYWAYEYPALKLVSNKTLAGWKKLTTHYFLEETKTHPLYPYRSILREMDFIASTILSKRNLNKPLYNIKITLSYMEPATSQLVNSKFRLLEVDNAFVLPTGMHVRLLITGFDVLHSWAVPSFGIKLDAVPGRLNSINIKLKREGVAYGQCSELCGANHGFMPIVVRVVSVKEYISVLKTALPNLKK